MTLLKNASTPALGSASKSKDHTHTSSHTSLPQVNRNQGFRNGGGGFDTKRSNANSTRTNTIAVPSFYSVYAELEDNDFDPGPGMYPVPGGFGT